MDEFAALGRLEAVERAMWQETTLYETTSHRPGDPVSTSFNVTGRDLLTPDEVMRLPPEAQLLRVQGQRPILARKLRYFADPEFAGLFVANTSQASQPQHSASQVTAAR